jgi:protein SCO1/2
VAVVALCLSGCRAGEDATPRRYPLTGLVLEDATASGQVTVAHDAIDGLMPAMAMPLTVRGNAPDLNPDDRIRATLVVAVDASWLEDVVVVERGGSSEDRRQRDADDEIIGRLVPDFRLRTHRDRAISFNDYRGRIVFVTFIYTRCPLPDYCPRMMRHLNDVKRVFDAEPASSRQLHYLAVSFDPAYDTPAILADYGARMVTGPGGLTSVDLATGTPAEVQAMAGFFGVLYREEGGQISHSLATAVVGADGRVKALFPSNTWAAADAIAAIRRELR